MKLSGLDSAFLALESDQWPAHVVCLTIVDASADGGRADPAAVRRMLAERLPRLPLLRRRLVQSPWGLTPPHWADDPDFDLDGHIRTATLPAPGGREELSAFAAEVYRHRLDRRRPLWEWWAVDGLENGRVAHLWKIHHACVDGRSGAAMQEVFFDRDPGAARGAVAVLPAPPEPLRPGDDLDDDVPDGWGRALVTALALAATPLRLGRQAAAFTRGVAHAALSGNLSRALPLHVPRTRFNEPVGRGRAYGFCTVRLSDVKKVKNAFGVQVNDVVLAACGGALRELLLAEGELPEEQLTATVPVDATRGASRSGGNMITGMLVGLGTHVEDPVERLLDVHESARSAKAVQKALGDNLLIGLADLPPPALLGAAGSAFRGARLSTLLPPVCNAVVSNVPGPRGVLYARGQKVEAFHSMGIIADGFGLFIGGMSYADQIDIGVLADAGALPRPFALADGIVEQLNLLLKAADGREPAGD